MRLFMLLSALVCCAAVQAADRQVLIVTPQGVWQIDMVGGIPQPPKPVDVTVIVHGFGNNPVPIPTPIPTPTTDPVIDAVAAESSKLANKVEATACFTLIDALKSAGLQGVELISAVDVAAPIVDTQMKSSGRITAWAKAVMLITTDPEKISVGLKKAWNMQAVLSAMDAQKSNRVMTAEESDSVATIDITMIMQIIAAVIALLKQLGILQ